jgi:hypothetical protein
MLALLKKIENKRISVTENDLKQIPMVLNWAFCKELSTRKNNI